MGENETISRDEFEGRKDLCDERFKRDSARLGNLETNQQTTADLLLKVSGILDTTVEKYNDHEKRLRTLEQKQAPGQGEDHEARLRKLESKPGLRMDALWGYAAAAAVGGVISWLFRLLGQ